ncbi:EGF-like domain-containing protein 2 isoform X2 [Gigantopelta aegis]|uniref:EGF-like domain-containing protein 2 isoform X2 n=1 Tax=Gigantopelta aegis TaxID=1735272 RepID=UPI001B889CAD|nr:EGF-like domain-containing protein 2 isoform X2 [Gigantopelta aegis]
MRAYVFLLVVLMITAATAVFWDCRNPQLSCSSPGTCIASGVCDGCTDKGHNCAFDLTNKDANDCSPTNNCENGASCSDDTASDSTVVCYCPPEYMGATCGTERFAATCSSTNMDVSFTPEFTPNGGVYVYKKPTCTLAGTGVGPYTKAVDHTGDAACGDAITATTGNITTWERKFIVVEDAAVVTTADFIIKVTCTHNKVTQVTHSIVSITENDDTAFGEVTGADELGLVTLSANPDTSPQNIGAVITFTITGSDGLEKIRIEKIEVSATGQTAKVIFDAGCPASNTGAYFGTPATSSTSLLVAEAKLLVVKFKDAANLEWSFTIKTCLTGDTTCDAATCSKRRKRAAQSLAGNSNHEVIRYKIDVIESANNGNEQKQASESECVTVNKMTAAVVAMAVACFILLVICLVFIVRVLSSRRYLTESKQNLS